MSTGPISNNSRVHPLSTSRTSDADKAKKASRERDGAESASRSDQTPRTNYDVKISPRAKSKAEAHLKALNIARNTPDVREDRVADLKAQIDAGTYKVDSGKVADSILREAILEHLAEADE